MHALVKNTVYPLRQNGNLRLREEAKRTVTLGGNDLNAVAWYQDNSDDLTHPVGQKEPNELGIYDMTGNVWEWCSDRSVEEHSCRVILGGAYDEIAYECQVAYTCVNTHSARDSGIGFRLVSPE